MPGAWLMDWFVLERPDFDWGVSEWLDLDWPVTLSGASYRQRRGDGHHQGGSSSRVLGGEVGLGRQTGPRTLNVTLPSDCFTSKLPYLSPQQLRDDDSLA